MTTPWGKVPQASFEFGLADHDGCLALFVIGGLHRSVATSFGERDAIRCSIVLLDGPEAGKEFEDILIFNARPVARFRSSPAGQITLARIGMAQGKGGNNSPVELYDASAEDEALAMRWHNYYAGRLDQIAQNIVASFQAEERKASQGNGRVQSQPHPTHAGSRAPSNQPFHNQHQPVQPSQPSWGAPAPAPAPTTAGVTQNWNQSNEPPAGWSRNVPSGQPVEPPF